MLTAALLAAPLAARAQVSAEAPTPAASAAADAAEPAPTPICTDRPTKSNYACTVDAGHLQYEADLVNASFLKLDGMTTDTWLVVNPTLKYGVAPDLDIEANISPLEIVRSHDDGGQTRTLAGVSDLYLRLKYEFIETTNDTLEVSAIPYVKAPTARPGLGNGVVEGGVILPVNYKLSEMFTLTTAPEIDADKDTAGDGRHLNTAQLVNLAATLTKEVTAYAELWGDWNFDPTRTIRQYSADVAVAYGVTSELQLDTGVNFGLNRETAGVQAYVGVSQKF